MGGLNEVLLYSAIYGLYCDWRGRFVSVLICSKFMNVFFAVFVDVVSISKANFAVYLILFIIMRL